MLLELELLLLEWASISDLIKFVLSEVVGVNILELVLPTVLLVLELVHVVALTTLALLLPLGRLI